jgi:glycosyltransferase involved in cell wall biosynthesis
VSAETRLAIVVSHPIQHFTPFYRAIAADASIELKVFFCARIGLERYFDREMNTEIAWAMDLLSGYEHDFLPGAEAIRRTGFLTVNNAGAGRALAQFAPDAVLLHGYGQLTLLRALVWSRLHRVPLLVIGDSELRHRRSRLRAMAKEMPLRFLAQQFAAILTVGDANEVYWRRYGAPEQKLFRSPFTIDEIVYRKARAERSALRARARERLAIPDSEVVALQVGKLSERKRPFDLVDAAALLAGDGLKLHCLFAGDGRLKDGLTKRIADKRVAATMLGFVNVDRLPEIYAAADLLAHPAEADPHPLVMSEAACIGLPLIVSDRIGAEGPTDIARAGLNAAVFPCADIPAFAETIRRVAFNPHARAGMSAASLAVFDELDMNRSISGLKAALAHALAARQSAAA